MAEVEGGCWTLADLVKINALIDMEADIINKPAEDATDVS